MPDRRLKLGASPSFHLPDLAGVLPDLVPDKPEEGRLETTYHDTSDLRLARWGGSLRHRATGWLLRLPDGRGARRDLSYAGRGAAVPAEVLRLVAGFCRGEPLVPVARLSTWRRRVRLRDDSGQPVVEVVDDEVSVLEGRRVAARFREVEINADGEVDLDPLLDRLREAGAGDEESIPKLVRAVGPPAQRPPDVEPVPPGPGATAGEAAQAGLAAAASALLRNDPTLRLGDDPDAIRRARVATRRLRSRLRTFSAYLDPAWAAELAGELEWLAGELSVIRDVDVRAERLRRDSALLDEADREHGLALAAAAAAEADRGRAALPAVLDSERYLALLDRVAAAGSAAPLAGEHERPAVEVVPALVRRRWKRLRAAVRALPDSPAAVDLHAVRIRAKQARYSAEAAAPFLPEAAEFGIALAAVQDALGDHHDSASLREWLRQAAGRSRRAFVAGILFEIEREAADRALAAFGGAWRAAKRPRLRKWMS